jgi:hypothetical protein
VERNGFRLTVVYRQGSDYGEPGDRLKAVVDSWFADLAALTAGQGAGAAAQAALRRNYVVRYATTKEHMEVMTHGALSEAIKSLPLGKATGAALPTGSAGKTPAPTPTPAPVDAGVHRAAASIFAPAGNRALARLLARSGPTLMRDDDEHEPDYAAEFASFARRGAVEGGLEGYIDIRDLLIGHFGSIAHANEYYRHVKQQAFLGVSPGPWVHDTTLGPALKKAEKLIADRGWTNEVVGRVSEAGGFNIRRNRNQPSVLSDHSFGWAVDVDADLNPNLAGHFPGRALAAVTGKDIVTEAMDRVNQGGTAQELLGSFEEIRAASDAFKDAFADETSLDAAMRDYLVTRLKIQVDADVKVVEMVRAAAGSGRAGAADKRALKDLLKAHWEGTPTWRPSSSARIARRSSPTRAGPSGKRRRSAGRGRASGPSRRFASVVPTPSRRRGA